MKLYEEINEYEESKIDEESLEEFADILELVYALGKMYDGSFEELNRIHYEKRTVLKKIPSWKKSFIMSELRLHKSHLRIPLQHQIDAATKIYMVVAFAQMSGVREIAEILKSAVERNAQVPILIRYYLYLLNRDALEILAIICEGICEQSVEALYEFFDSDCAEIMNSVSS